MKFDRAYLLFINISARLFGAMALLFGIFASVCAYAFTEDRWMYIVAGIFAIAEQRQRDLSYRVNLVNSPRLDSPLLVEVKLTPQNQNLSGRRPPLAEDESGQHDQISQQPQNVLKSHNHGVVMPHRLYPEHQLSRSNKCGPQGKRGDLIVLDRDIFAIDPFGLHDTRVMATYFDGREVYAAKAK